MATQRQRGSFYEPDRVYTQDEFNALLRDLAAREDLARRDFSNLQTTYGFDPGGRAQPVRGARCAGVQPA